MCTICRATCGVYKVALITDSKRADKHHIFAFQMSETELQDNAYLHYVSFGDVFLLLNIMEVDGTCGALKKKKKTSLYLSL